MSPWFSQRRRRRCAVLLSCLLLLGPSPLLEARTPFSLDQELLHKVERQYGAAAGKRVREWQMLIQEDESSTDREKLEKVNTFINKTAFVSDLTHWHTQDYWATPVELLASDGGDCEDFSLAKYFTLKKMGVDENKLNMTYVKSLTLKQAHMVLTYYSTPDAEPLVLDNLIPTIEPASRRPDLLPVYSFNGMGLWLAKSRGRGQLVGGSDNLKRWQDLLQRLPEGLN